MSDQLEATFSQGDGGWTALANQFSVCDEASVCNQYLKDHRTVPPYSNFPPFNDMNIDCPASTSDLFERVAALASQPAFFRLAVQVMFPEDPPAAQTDQHGGHGR